jgi:hypothetical protein
MAKTITLQQAAQGEAAPDAEVWTKIPRTCEEMQCGPSRVYEILANIESEDPNGILKTFIFRSPHSRRGTRLFELGSVRKFMAWKYQEAEATERKRREARRREAAHTNSR